MVACWRFQLLPRYPAAHMRLYRKAGSLRKSWQAWQAGEPCSNSLPAWRQSSCRKPTCPTAGAGGLLITLIAGTERQNRAFCAGQTCHSRYSSASVVVD